MDTVDTKHPVSARIPDWIQIFVKVDTGYRIGYKILLEWIPDTGLDTDFFKVDTGYRIGYKILSEWIQDTGLDTRNVSEYRIYFKNEIIIRL